MTFVRKRAATLASRLAASGCTSTRRSLVIE
jgi:hypothetical protein